MTIITTASDLAAAIAQLYGSLATFQVKTIRPEEGPGTALVILGQGGDADVAQMLRQDLMDAGFDFPTAATFAKERATEDDPLYCWKTPIPQPAFGFLMSEHRA